MLASNLLRYQVQPGLKPGEEVIMRQTAWTVMMALLMALLASAARADHRYTNDRYGDERFANDRYFFNDSPWQLAAVLEDKADRLERYSDRQHGIVHHYGSGHYTHSGYESHNLENLFDQFEQLTDRLRSSLRHRGYVSRDAQYHLRNASYLARQIDAQMSHLRVLPEIQSEWSTCREILYRLERQL